MGLFHCFGCGQGGDVISFLMKIEGRPFVEVATDLAGRFGVQLPIREQSSQEREAEQKAHRERENLLSVNAQAMEFYHGLLLRDPGARHAREYLQKRGITDATLRQFKLGYAPNAWDVLSTFFARNGADLPTVFKAGLVQERERSGGYYDRFRNRLLFPILGQNSEVLGFGGRQLADGDGAKYLNSPESPLFHKGRCLFGLNVASAAARRASSVLVVEGYFDQIALFQAGVENVVATLGTALTEEHVQLLRRNVREVLVMFDGDEAGIRASQKSAEVLLRAGLVVRVVELPKGDDPDSFVLREGRDAFEAKQKAARPIIEFVIDSSAERTDGTPGGKARCVDALKPLFAHVESPVERALYVARIADRLRVPESAVEAALGIARAPQPERPEHGGRPGGKSFGGGRFERGPGRDGRGSHATFATQFAVRESRAADARTVLASPAVQLVSLVLAHPSLAARAAAEPADFEDARLHELCARAAGAYERDGRIDAATVLASLDDEALHAQLFEQTLAVQEAEAGVEESAALAHAEKALHDVCWSLRERRLREEAALLQRRLAQAAASGDQALVLQLSQERMTLERKIRGRTPA